MRLTDDISRHFDQEDLVTTKHISESASKDSYPELHEALDLERDLYQDLARALPLGIYRLRVFHEVGTSEDRWNSKDNAPFKIEFVNNRFFDILDIDRTAFINNPGILNNYIFEEDKPEFVRKNIEANRNPAPFSWEGRFMGKDQLLWIHFESIPRILENKDILWTGYFEDISERIKKEEELRQKNKELQLLNAEKDKFLSIIAHDLKSPFNSIIGFSGILLDKLARKDIKGIKEYAEIIKNSSHRAMNLLQNLVLWSQSQTGHMNFNPQYFDLEELMDEIIQLYESVAAQKSIQLTKVCAKPIRLYADKAMIGTVIRNLVSNAIKFTPNKGSIQIMVSSTSDKAAIMVRDSGVGMTQATMRKIFHIDSNHSTPDTNGEKGTGLGLLLCKEFIDKHNGTIRIESEQGKGSVFLVEIPVSQLTIND